MSRPMLIFGFTFAAVCFACCKLGVNSAYIAVGISVSALLVFVVIRPLHKIFEIPLTAGAVLLSAVVFLLFFNYNYKDAAVYDGETGFTGKVISASQKYYENWSCEIETVSIGERFTKQKLVYISQNEPVFGIYDCISVSDGKVFIPKNSRGEESETYKAQGIFLKAYSEDAPKVIFTYDKSPMYYILRLRQSIINTIENYLSDDRAGIAIAMVIGDTSHISAQTRYNFADSGAAHLLAVSGLNVSLWVSFLVAFLTVFGFKGKSTSVIAILFLAFFVILTGFSPSIIRASCMFIILLIAPFFKRRGDSLNSLGLAVFLITLFNPYAVLSVSLQLSVTATLGIVTAGKFLTGRFAALTMHLRYKVLKRLVNYVADIVIITVCAFVFTLPITVAAFGKVSIIAPITNLLVMGLSSLTMVFAGTGALFAYSDILLPVAKLWFSVTNTLTGLILSCVNKLGSLTFSSVPVEPKIYSFWIVAVLLLTMCCTVIYYRRKTRMPLEVVSVLCVVLFVVGNIAALLPSSDKISGTVLELSGSPVIILRNGRHYALIGCPSDSYSFMNKVREQIPQSPATSLDMLLIPSGTLGTDSFQQILSLYKPKEVFTDFSVFRDNSDILSDTYGRGLEARYILWDEIILSYYNTDNAKCVIIEFNGNVILVSLSENNDIEKISRAYAQPDTLIFSSAPPENLAGICCDRIIISGTYSKKRDSIYNKVLLLNQNTYFTAYEGNINIIGKERAL